MCMCTEGRGRVYNRQCAAVKLLVESKCSYTRNNRPTRRARLRSRSTVSSGMRHTASSCTSNIYTHVYLATYECRCSLVGRRQAPDPRSARKRAGKIIQETCTHRAKARFAWDTWPNRLVLKVSLQTNHPLKSGPTKARPPGSTPPLL